MCRFLAVSLFCLAHKDLPVSCVSCLSQTFLWVSASLKLTIWKPRPGVEDSVSFACSASIVQWLVVPSYPDKSLASQKQNPPRDRNSPEKLPEVFLIVFFDQFPGLPNGLDCLFGKAPEIWQRDGSLYLENS